MNDKKFYITAAIPYVNGKPHVGHALEFVQGDVMARYKKIMGFDTIYVSGSDENGLKIVQAAEKQQVTPQELADRNTRLFLQLIKLLNVDIDVWRRGSDKKLHWPGTEKLWKLGERHGDIYKKMYGGFYCVGCEDFYTKKDLVNGKCPEHLTEPEWVEEENYFFKLSRYQKQIENLIRSDKLLVVPQARKNEVLSFIESGLEDFSISRSRKRAKNWGIPVPGDDNQVIYTWYDGLNIYQTAVGYGYDEELWEKWWPADIHVIGKGIVRFHAVYWIGMLLSSQLPLPKSIFIHGYISSGGHKMSKSLGNVIDPFDVVKKYGTDATRYYLLREIPTHGDGDFTYERFEQIYNADLANGLGNLIARVSKLCEKVTFKTKQLPQLNEEYSKDIEDFRFNEVLEVIWNGIRILDKKINDQEPWKITNKKRLTEILQFAVDDIRNIALELRPFLPQTAEKILTQFSQARIKSEAPFFPRII